jgi:hypothetical protein
MGNGINISTEMIKDILEHQYSMLHTKLTTTQAKNVENYKEFIDEWIYLMNRPDKDEPYGTNYTFKELYEKYVLPCKQKEK